MKKEMIFLEVKENDISLLLDVGLLNLFANKLQEYQQLKLQRSPSLGAPIHRPLFRYKFLGIFPPIEKVICLKLYKK